MTARRIAKDQPETFAWTKESRAEVNWWLKKYPGDRRRSAVIPMLWIAQKQEGWVTEPAMRAIGAELDMAHIRVMEVASFYTMFNLAPAGEHLIQVCGTTPCMIRGSQELNAVCERKIGPKGELSADGKFSWMEVECLGACANAPMVQVSTRTSDHYFEDLTPESLEKLLDDLAAGREVTPGPQNGRQTSAPAGEPKTLTDKKLYDGSLAKPVTLPNTAPKENA